MFLKKSKPLLLLASVLTAVTFASCGKNDETRNNSNNNSNLSAQEQQISAQQNIEAISESAKASSIISLADRYEPTLNEKTAKKKSYDYRNDGGKKLVNDFHEAIEAIHPTGKKIDLIESTKKLAKIRKISKDALQQALNRAKDLVNATQKLKKLHGNKNYKGDKGSNELLIKTAIAYRQALKVSAPVVKAESKTTSKPVAKKAESKVKPKAKIKNKKANFVEGLDEGDEAPAPGDGDDGSDKEPQPKEPGDEPGDDGDDSMTI